MKQKPLNETPLVYLVTQAHDAGCHEIADKAERMAELLAKCAGELTALGSDADEAGSVLYQVHAELYT
jgi:hypothetical protein